MTDVAAADWAASGAMWLTGRPSGSPLLPPGNAASVAGEAMGTFETLSARLGRRVRLDGRRLLGERAAAAGLCRQGPWSPARTFQLFPAADRLMGLSLARPSDIELVPALVESGSDPDPWAAVLAWAAERPADEAVARARLLGLPACVVGATGSPSAAAPVRVERVRPAPPARPLVVDLSSLWAGPLCAHLLGLAGARVVKVESPARPDGARRGPAAFYRLLHAGHESVALDFAAADDRARLVGLLEAADVVIEASRPRALAQLGIDAAAVLASGTDRTWVSITAYGRTAPAAGWVGFGDDTAAAAGLVAVDPTTGVTVPCGDAIADPLAGIQGAVAALRSLLAGGRRLISVALCDVVAATLGPAEGSAERLGVGLAGGLGVERPQIRPAEGRARPLGADTDRVLTELGLR